MDTIIYLVRITALTVISVLSLAMMGRALLSFIDPMQEMKLSGFLITVTEPIILPVRALCERFHWFEGLPIDVPFSITFFILMIIEVFLGG